MKQAIILMFTILTLVSLSKCISTARIRSSPVGAEVYFGENLVGMTPYDHKDKSLAFTSKIVTLKKEGYKNRKLRIKKNDINWLTTLLGCPFTYGVLCLWMAEYPEENYTIKLRKGALNERENLSVADSQKFISRNLHWKIHSEPGGAAVNYRVLSHTETVSTTSNIYLDRTPYEGVKRLDIKGLKHGNMKHVVLVIEVSKKGYYSQKKEIAITAAIQQSEISMFFPLVKKE